MRSYLQQNIYALFVGINDIFSLYFIMLCLFDYYCNQYFILNNNMNLVFYFDFYL